jgi:hypothetical protein
MIRLLSDFVCSRIREHATTLQADARVKYLRRLAVAYYIWIWLAALLGLISVGATTFTVISSLDTPRKIGYAVLFIICAAVSVIFSGCFLVAFRFTSDEAKRKV